MYITTKKATLLAAAISLVPTDLGKTFEAVNLGLPSGIKWATCNLGATLPEGYGDYFE